jgi:hypothetical protein
VRAQAKKAASWLLAISFALHRAGANWRNVIPAGCPSGWSAFFVFIAQLLDDAVLRDGFADKH